MPYFGKVMRENLTQAAERPHTRRGRGHPSSHGLVRGSLQSARAALTFVTEAAPVRVTPEPSPFRKLRVVKTREPSPR